MISLPHASRRRNKWYVKLKRHKHMAIWAALCLTLVVVIGVAVARFIRHQQTEEDKTWFGEQKVTISPKFKTSQ